MNIKGIDVSQHNGNIDFTKVKAAGYKFVIIRCNNWDNNYNCVVKDTCFESNYRKAKAAGLDVGVYYFTWQTDAAGAQRDARLCQEYIKGKTFEYPVYLDFESGTVRDYLNKDSTRATEICYAFMDTMRDAGYLVGLYGYAGWFDPGYNGWMASTLDNNIGKKYEFWMANYFNNMLPENTKTANYKNKYGMYQYTSSKKISGWSGSLDHNVCYKDYPSIVKQYGFNGYEPGGKIETEKPTEAETVKPNRYAITDDIKKIKEHIGSGISEYAIDGNEIEATDSITLEAGQKLSIKGYAGFTNDIKEFGYYFDGNEDSAVMGVKGTTANASTKKKAGDKAKSFEIAADTKDLTAGAHTVTYVVKLANKTCELITLNLNVGGGSGSGTGEAESGCNSAIGIGSALSIMACIGGAALILKKKKED
jgi:GH25 family lysozyme M1 (1,4-beta-N-acetylmuramidase)